MDTTNQGYSTLIPINNPWTLSVEPIHDELLSSWLIRSALINGCDPISLTSSIWGGWQIWAVDFDRSISTEHLSTLANLLNVDIHYFKKLTLQDISRTINHRALPTKQLWPWLLSTGTRNKNRKGGLQYCPKCFSEDTPYYKQQWRYAWHTHCIKHKTPLLDKCQSCQLPLEPHKLEAIKHSLNNCSNCSFNLAKASVQETSKLALQFQHTTDSGLAQERYNYHSVSMLPHQWFRLIIFFIQLVKRITKRNHQRLLQFANQINLPIENIPSHTATLENMITSQRINIFAAVQHLLNIEPSSLYSSLVACDISQQAFAPKNIKLPKCLTSIYYQLSKTPYSQKTINRPKPKLPLPRPRHEVERRAIDIIRALKS